MLRFLRVRDYALIRELEIEFGPGLSLLTGETGSGKSIVVDAIDVLTGERTNPEMIRSGADTAVVEGVFALEDAERVAPLLQSAGVDCEEGTLLIRREISNSGRNRVFLNSCLGTLGLLRAVGGRLVDIHGQHDRQSLLDLSTHLQWLDRFGGNGELVAEVRQIHGRLKELSEQISSLTIDEQERLRRIDMLRYQLDEIRRAGLRAGEREELETEKTLLANRERIASLSAEAYAALYDSELSILSQTKRVVRLLQDLEAFDAAWSQHREPLQEELFRFEDIAYRLRDYSAKLDFAPERLNQVEQRLADIDRLLRKYGESVPVVLAHAEMCEKELVRLEDYADGRRSSEAELERQLRRYMEAALRLSEKRRQDASRFEREVRREFEALAMERMDLRIHFHPRDVRPADAGRIPAGCGPWGLDRVEFMAAPNRGEEIRPLARIASGGELSRIMLAVKTLCGGDDPKTLVFDEVDSGVGGRVAEAVGKRLRGLAARNQVFCVTHLPQIAAFADQHFRVTKEVGSRRTETRMNLLARGERLEELARMLGGEIVAESARRHARELLDQARPVVRGRA